MTRNLTFGDALQMTLKFMLQTKDEEIRSCTGVYNGSAAVARLLTHMCRTAQGNPINCDCGSISFREYIGLLNTYECTGCGKHHTPTETT
jgi:hypothetical protein